MQTSTVAVSDAVFKQVYDSPASLPGKFQWTTPTDELRKIEGLLGMPEYTIGAPLWVSGDQKYCPKCQRQTKWLDIVASALKRTHKAEMIARVILGQQKYVNTEAPRAIAGLTCFQCQAGLDNLRSFKCHNWAYAIGDLQEVIDRMNVGAKNP